MTFLRKLGSRPGWTKLTAADFPDLFYERFEHSAFRLETLAHYADPDEAAPFQTFLDGGDPPEWRDAWLRWLAEITAQGKQMSRVHLVAEPWSPYVEFELTRIYPSSVEAGEDVRISTNPSGLPAHDFWLVDGTACRMRYTSEGVWVATEYTSDPERVAKYEAWRDRALANSMPLETYLERAMNGRPT